MRMWMLPSNLLCSVHLCAEHYEIHKAAGCIRNNRTNWHTNLANNGYLELHNLGSRHNELAAEMVARGYKHRSPLVQPDVGVLGKVDVARSVKDLTARCSACASRVV